MGNDSGYDADTSLGIVSDLESSYEYDGVHLVHVDDVTVEELEDVSKQRYVYIFDDEDTKDELRRVIDDFREQFLFATGIVVPAWLRGDLHDLDDDVVNAICWLLVLGVRPDPEDIDTIRRNI